MQAPITTTNETVTNSPRFPNQHRSHESMDPSQQRCSSSGVGASCSPTKNHQMEKAGLSLATKINVVLELPVHSFSTQLVQNKTGSNVRLVVELGDHISRSQTPCYGQKTMQDLCMLPLLCLEKPQSCCHDHIKMHPNLSGDLFASCFPLLL